MKKAKLTRKHKDKYGKCDRCRKTKKVSEYWFKDADKKWTRWWCQTCLEHWINLNTELIKTLKETVNRLSQRWFERIITKIKTILRINRGKS